MFIMIIIFGPMHLQCKVTLLYTIICTWAQKKMEKCVVETEMCRSSVHVCRDACHLSTKVMLMLMCDSKECTFHLPLSLGVAVNISTPHPISYMNSSRL